MSLDVHLTGEAREVECICANCGNEHASKEADDLYDANITHNLGPMAKDAGIYMHLWRPEEIEITKAAQLIEPLKAGIELMKSDPVRFEAFNPPNGWGKYEHFVPFVEQYLAACIEYPDADVRVSR